MKYLLSEITSAVNGNLKGEDRTIQSVITDSRSEISEDCIFIAINGINHDGHDYINYLYEKGVRSFIIQKEIEEINDASFIIVQDSITALQSLAEYHRNRYNGEMVAITGSNGKTIVKEWIAQMWDPAYGKLNRSPKSWNSQIGVALSLLKIKGDERLCIIEAGISQKGEMERLERMIKPTIGILTCVGSAHLENFKDKDELHREKMKLFTNVNKLIIGEETGNIDERNIKIVNELFTYLGIPFNKEKHLEPVAMRMEHAEGILDSDIINDSYNCDCLSFPLALDQIDRMGFAKDRKRIVILSDFREEVSYDAINCHLLNHHIDMLIAIGPKMYAHSSSFTIRAEYYKSTEDFLKNHDTSIFKKAVILIKGGRSWAMERISSSLELRTHTTTHHINLRALTENLNYYRQMLPPDHPVMAMVKASCYGAGDIEIAKVLIAQGVKYLDVAFADEGITLREGGISAPIVVLNGDPGSFSTMIRYHLEPEIYSFSALIEFHNEVIKAGETEYPVHLKMDTGMHRLGFMEHEIDKLISTLNEMKEIHISSIFSHFAASEDPNEDEFTRKQIDTFRRMTEKISSAFPYRILRHICNTTGIVRFKDAHFDMVRVGIGLYGAEDRHLQTVSTLKTRIVQTKFLEEGETVGYNRHGKVGAGGKRIAIIPIGYADGLNRKLSRGNACFNIGGILCPTIGNICMDTTMVDISNAPEVKEGDEVIIFGEKPTVEELAKAADTISYEILTSISQRIKKIYEYE